MISNSSKLLLVVILSILLIVLSTVFIFVAYDVWSKNQKTSELLSQANHDAEVEVLVQSIRLVQNSAAEDIQAFNDMVLSSDKLVVLIENIEGAGRALNLDINISSVGNVEEKKPVAETGSKNATQPHMISISIETQGSWASTLSFLRAIESLPHRVMIDGVTLSKGETRWQSRINLSLYLFD